MFGFFRQTEDDKRADFIRRFIEAHYSTYRDGASMDRIAADAKTAWEAIRTK